MFLRYRFRDVAVLPLTAAGIFLLLSGAAMAQSDSATPTNVNGVSLHAFGQEASSASVVPMVAADPSQNVVLPPIPREIRGRDHRSWWQRRKDRTAEAARLKGEAMAAETAEAGQQNVIQPARAGSRAGSAAEVGDNRASAEVVPAAPVPTPAPPAPVVASYDAGSEVPVTHDGQALRAFGSKQKRPAPVTPDLESSYLAPLESPTLGPIPTIESGPSISSMKRKFLPWNWFK